MYVKQIAKEVDGHWCCRKVSDIRLKFVESTRVNVTADASRFNLKKKIFFVFRFILSARLICSSFWVFCDVNYISIYTINIQTYRVVEIYIQIKNMDCIKFYIVVIILIFKTRNLKCCLVLVPIYNGVLNN